MAYATGYGPRSRLIFDGDERKYELWEVKFLGFMRLQKLNGVFTPVEGSDPPSAEKKAEAFAELIQCLDDRSLSLVIRDAKDDGKKALDILREHYLGKSKPRVIALYTELTTLLKKEGESVTDYMLRAETAATSLKTAGEVISDSLLIAMILKGLPPMFKTLCTVITQREKEVTFPEFKVALRSFEETEKQNSLTDDTVMKVNDVKGVQCYLCKKYGHKSFDCRSKKTQNSNQAQAGYKKKWCNTCKSATHDTRQCRKKDTVKTVTETPPPDTQSYAFRVSENQSMREDSLLVDCGATTHIITQRSKFTSFEENFDAKSHYIELADGSRSNDIVEGRGKAKVCINDSCGKPREVSLENVLYIPSYKQDIFSVQAATEKGATVKFCPDAAELVSSDGTVFDICKNGKLYYLNSIVNNTSENRSASEWHRILGHCNRKDILKLEAVVNGMKIRDRSEFQCDVCTMGKMTQSFNRQSDERATEKLALVHCDLSGPVDPVSKDGFRYAILFVDDFTGASSVYFLRQKCDAVKATEKFLADCAPFSKVQRLRTDNGTEFTCHEFKSLMLKHSIKHEKSSPYSPHQNGTVERNWRSLFDMARCLLIESQLPKAFWTYAVSVSVYTRNRCFCPRTGKTPYELLTGKKPNVGRMSVFGTVCYAYVQNTKKLDPRSEKGLFVGYDRDSPAYLVYFKGTGDIKRVRCVKFTNKFDGSKCETDGDIDDCDSIETRPVVQNVPTVSTESDIQSNDLSVSTEDQNIAQTDSDARYPKRIRSRPKHLNDYVLADNSVNFTVHYCYRMSDIPTSYASAMASVESQNWKSAMEEEMNSLLDNDTFRLTSLPEGKKVVGGRWVYAVKLGPNGEEQFKARYVAKGYSQTQDVDYHEIFSPTARMTSIRMLMQIAVKQGLILHQMDVKTAYLNAPIDCEIYMEQPEGFISDGENGEKLFWRLQKSLYGLKQSGRNWNNMLHEYLINEKFEQSLVDHCVYTRVTADSKVILLVWVDDIIIAADSILTLTYVKNSLCLRFKMKDIGPLSWFLGIQFICQPDKIELNQSQYIEKILTKFNMADCKPRATPCDLSWNRVSEESEDNIDDPADEKLYRSIVGSLIYAMSATRPDICFVVTHLSQFMSRPKKSHLCMAKHVLRYLRGTINYGLTYKKNDTHLNLNGFCDADWGSSQDRRSITGYTFHLFQNGPLISWKCRKQPTVALSTCEAEYMSICAAVQEAKFLVQLLKDMSTERENETVILNVDSQSAIALVKNPVFHQRSKQNIYPRTSAHLCF